MTSLLGLFSILSFQLENHVNFLSLDDQHINKANSKSNLPNESKTLGLGTMGYESEAIMGRKHLVFLCKLPDLRF